MDDYVLQMKWGTGQDRSEVWKTYGEEIIHLFLISFMSDYVLQMTCEPLTWILALVDRGSLRERGLVGVPEAAALADEQPLTVRPAALTTEAHGVPEAPVSYPTAPVDQVTAISLLVGLIDAHGLPASLKQCTQPKNLYNVRTNDF